MLKLTLGPSSVRRANASCLVERVIGDTRLNNALFKDLLLLTPRIGKIRTLRYSTNSGLGGAGTTADEGSARQEGY